MIRKTIFAVFAAMSVSGSQAAVTFGNLTGAPSFGSAFIGGPAGVVFPNESIALEITTDSQA